MTKFVERINEKEGQRRKRFLQFLRELPKPDGVFDEKRKVWIPNKKETPVTTG